MINLYNMDCLTVLKAMGDKTKEIFYEEKIPNLEIKGE